MACFWVCDTEKATASQKKPFEEAKSFPDSKVPKLKAQHQASVTTHNERQFDLTPSDLKTLLPGGGSIRGQFWARYNPTEHWFSVSYPISALALMPA